MTPHNVVADAARLVMSTEVPLEPMWQQVWYTGMCVYAAMEIPMWIAILFFYLLDKYLDPATRTRYKLQPNQKDVMQGYNWQTLSQVLFNHTFLGFPFCFAIGYFLESHQRTFAAPLPSFLTMASQFLFIGIWQDILFYIFHRILHLSCIYGSIHKVHHLFKAPIGLAAQYVHPVEFVLQFMQISLSALYQKVHPALICFWLGVVIIINISSHSGYRVSFYNPISHDLHHKYFNVNFGSNDWLDILFGTHHSSPNIRTWLEKAERQPRDRQKLTSSAF